MRNRYIYISLLSFFVSLAILGQEKKIAKADKDYDQLSYIDARNVYIEVVENGYESQDIYEKIADSYYYNADLSNASIWYEKLYSKYRSTIEPEYLFRYSQSLKNVKKYEESDQIMLEFDDVTGRNEKRVELFNEERNYLELIKLQSGKFDIKNLSNINSKGSDFGPSFYKGESVVFASSRESGVSKTVHEWNESEFLDLFLTNRSSSTSLNVNGLDRLNNRVNTKLHESSTVFTKDGNTMYFTRNNFTKKRVKTNSEGTTLLKLYKAELIKNKWTNVVELPFNSDEYSVAHPALSPDEKKLYFASDMPGTKGLSDLFVVDVLGDNTYSTPVNLGDNINTEGRETFPFISETGKIFFASDGHIGLGGLDVFIALPNEIKISDSEFKAPLNIGAPINTSDDDFSFILDEQNKVGYFSSNRALGVGGDDIYSFKQTKDLIIKCSQFLSGVITDAESRELLPDAVVTLFNQDMEKVAVTTADENAFYELPVDCTRNYIIRAQKDGYEPTEVDFATNNQYEFKHNQPIQLSKGAPVLQVVKADIGDDLVEILQLNPIYFDLDKSFIRPDAEIELQKIIAVMRKHPKLEIDVRSHTDSRASYQYNIDLSSRRANSTMNYLVEVGGISKSRLTGRGYGEVQLQNECADDVPCSEEKHQLNRRSEFIIVKQ